jgi:hypothetical protein
VSAGDSGGCVPSWWTITRNDALDGVVFVYKSTLDVHSRWERIIYRCVAQSAIDAVIQWNMTCPVGYVYTDVQTGMVDGVERWMVAYKESTTRRVTMRDEWMAILGAVRWLWLEMRRVVGMLLRGTLR